MRSFYSCILENGDVLVLPEMGDGHDGVAVSWLADEDEEVALLVKSTAMDSRPTSFSFLTTAGATVAQLLSSTRSATRLGYSTPVINSPPHPPKNGHASIASAISCVSSPQRLSRFLTMAASSILLNNIIKSGVSHLFSETPPRVYFDG